MPQTANDINLDHPLVRFLPRNWLPFAALIRLDRPVGTYLAFLPALMGLNLAMQYVPYDQRHFSDWLFWSAIFLFGAWTMRSVGCIWNDWLDRDFDSQVLRTQHRPIASGQVTLRAAFWLMAGLLGLAASLLLLLPRNVLWVALLIILGVLAYPMMKRWIDAPQVWLGITFNSGIWVAWIAVNGLSNVTPPLLLYSGCICWTVAYDTVYALQDRSDDSRMGIRSLALTLGRAEVFGIFMLYLFCCVFWSILLYQASQNGAMSATWTFGISASVFALAWLYLWVCALRWYLLYRNANVSPQAESSKLSSEEQRSVANHGAFFRENAIFGFLIALSLL